MQQLHDASSRLPILRPTPTVTINEATLCSRTSAQIEGRNLPTVLQYLLTFATALYKECVDPAGSARYTCSVQLAGLHRAAALLSLYYRCTPASSLLPFVRTTHQCCGTPHHPSPTPTGSH